MKSRGWHRAMAVVLLLLLLAATSAEHVQELKVSEGAAVGTRIGFIGDGVSSRSDPPYFVVGSVDDLSIDVTTGEIRTKVPLDRERSASYSFVAVGRTANVRVFIKVLDENDNAPTFPTPVMSIEFPENTPRDFKRTLYPAKDLDLDAYNTQCYNIVSGNVNNAFRLSSHRERDGVLYLDLQINGFLDREATAAYSLVIEALDGGVPPLRGEMLVNITIQDVNDNQPIFNQSRYFATVPENATIGTSVLQVFATDEDAGENGQVEYSINRRQSDRDNMFRIDPTTGMIAVNKPLDFETKELHELVIVAKDHGLQPLETTAFVSIKVTDVNDNQPTINVIFLSDDATPKISESAQPGEFVARISVHDPDSKTEYSNINVTLSGGDGHFNLTTQNSVIYLVVVSLPLDRELQPNYTLNVVATDTGTPPLHAAKTINLQVTDINDNAPEFENEIYETNVMEVSDPGTSVIQVVATDKDEGNNSAITYSLADTPETHSGWFQVDPRSGLVTTKAHVDCETDPMPKLTVIATDNGFPSLSASATVLVTIHDVNDNEPIFDQSFYNVSVAENETKGRCILKVSATDPDCGVNAMVNYTLGDSFGKQQEFTIRSATGEICISSSLDYETRNVYEFPIVATDRGGLSTTAVVKIQVTDVNDNRPTFYPREYNVSLREGGASPATAPVVTVAATDPDAGRFGAVSYRIAAGNEAGLFRVDRNSGEIFVSRPGLLSARGQPRHRLSVAATDGGGLRAAQDAQVFVSVIDAAQSPPIFESPRYSYSVREDVRRDTVIGSVKASVRDYGGQSGIRYSIYSGDPDGLFRIDAITGSIQTASALDHETKSTVLLNVQATSGDPPVYGHTQVNIEIEDVNDNAPEFDSPTVRISVPENADTGVALYAAHARDRDSGANGAVRYSIVGGAAAGLFDVHPTTGHLTLKRHLDYEAARRHALVVAAADAGTPPLSANLTVLVEVQDVNDNPPVFERAEYRVEVLETLPVNSQILQVVAVDLDTGNNARLTYRLLSASKSGSKDRTDVFGVFPNSGWIYLRGALDREAADRYDLVVAAADNGTPSQTATARVAVAVLDANDNDPVFARESYEFYVEENLDRGAVVGAVGATDKDSGVNAAIRYSLIPGNTSFHIDPRTGEITTKASLDREQKEVYDLVAEARDQGTPSRSTRVTLRIEILDVNDNAPEIVDPQEDVVSVREEQPPGTEVVRVKAIDADKGQNATVTYAILKGKDSDGYGVFSIDQLTGIIRTRMVLDHEEKTIYRLAVAATDGGSPAKQTVRMLRVEVLDLNDNRPTFTSSSLIFRVFENVRVGYIVGSVATTDSSSQENIIPGSSGGHVTYTLTSLMPDNIKDAFEIDRNTGSLVVSRELDREVQSEYRLEVRALDTSAMNNPQSSAVTVRVDIADVNDNAPEWPEDPVTLQISEDTEVGTSVHNFTATDKDSGSNGDLRYSLVKQYPNPNIFTIDALTGTLVLASPLDYELLQEHTVIIRATDQSINASERLASTVTARVIITDANDNPPKFVVPSTSNVLISESAIVGSPIVHVVAVDKDSGDNGRVTYVISSGNEGSQFAVGYETGFLTLAKPLTAFDASKTFVLNVTASDHGSPTRHASIEMKLSIHGSLENPPRFLKSVYYASIAEDASVGSFVAKVSAKSGFLEQGGNLTFHIPSGLNGNTFEIHPSTGSVITKKSLDRETTATYTIPIYAVESGNGASSGKSLFDVTTLVIAVTDVNDNVPEFAAGSCYPLAIPENNGKLVVHTVAASDLDADKNSQITYSITSGNFENKFSIDSLTGELTANSLDREAHHRYHLTITAQDRGSPSLKSSCNITVLVEDQNDNDPKFDFPKYSATILEDVLVDTSVLRVHASDADVGVNARLIYSLANESQWLFRIDNKTGVITTAGLFDRERQSVFNFLVVATDNGKYNARSQKVPVTIVIGDVNDNKPIFTRYPFNAHIPHYVPAGQTVIKVTARDADQGMNSEIVYSLPNDEVHNRFRINPNTGILTTTQSLSSENGKAIYLNVVATDKGNPPQTSTGLVEIIVGDISESSPQLRFQNSTYNVMISENTDQFRDVLQVSAIRTDGRKQKILYSIGMGNEENIFVINSETGIIQVRDPKFLDYELHNRIRLVVEAKTEGNNVRHGYCDVIINLVDQNDNAPKFTQQQYTASVWEGKSKGTFVLQVVAFDADQDRNSRVLYHIVDGNHDNAFLIEPVFSGILKTNIVLDREIRDKYRLTVIATDEGVPQMTGTARISINVVDVNDNQPTFPPHSVITVGENTKVGSVLTTVTANDVDTNPTLTYDIAKESGKEALKYFAIDRYSGKVILKQQLDFEIRQEYTLLITASDTAHVAQTTLTVKVADVNDNAPVFSSTAYHATLPDGNSMSLVDILTVNASDADMGDNGLIRYSLVNPLGGFSIGSEDGTLRANLSNVSLTPSHDIELVVKAYDLGKPSLWSFASVRLQVNSASGSNGQIGKREYRIQIPEDTPTGKTILHVASPFKNTFNHFVITEGSDDGTFEISNPNGALVLVKPLDREMKEAHTLKISTGDGIFSLNNTAVTVYIIVEDVNDNAPVFDQTDYEEIIGESVPIGTTIKQISATDNDLAGTANSQISYEITSGNDDNLFSIDQTTGAVKVNNTLDCDEGIEQHRLVISACDEGTPTLCSLATLHISLEDENDNDPKFPVAEYLEFVGENEPVGTPIFAAHATDADKGIYGSLNYSIVNSTSNVYGADESWRFFNIDAVTGLVSTNAIFDYEQRNRYVFFVLANDVGGRTTSVRVRVEIESRDEFHPQFTEKTYRFVLATPPHGALPVGYVIGHVTATDRDKGSDGRVVYQLTNQHMFFKINRTTGAIIVKRKLDNSELLDSGKDISLIVTASSGKQGSLTNNTVVEITLDPLGDPGTNLAINKDNATVAAANGGLTDWALGLLISLLLLIITFGAVFVFLHMRNKRNKNINKPNLGGEAVTNANNYVDPTAFDTIPIRGPAAVVPGGNNQFGPPKYDKIPPYGTGHAASSNSGAATTSELSGSEQSGSSGRGSAEDGEDGEDEEIRMINEGPLQRESGIHQNDDEDNLSDVSVRNTQEYLARLGIVNNSNSGMQMQQAVSRICSDPRAGSSKDAMHHHQGVPLDSLHMFDEEGNNENDITNLIYAKLNDVAGSDRASSADEAGGVASTTLGSTMDHVMAIGGYNEVPTVTHQPSMNGSLSSIVHSEEELAGSYNWDYLLDWGPQYQPLAHVFSEIARLKDDTASVQSAASGNSSVKSKNSAAPAKSVPPPLITSVAPRSIAVPVLNSRGGSSHHANQMIMLPRSPINHDGSGGTFGSSTAMSPSFSPSLSPLATKSPSISPLVTPGLPTTHHVMQRQAPQLRSKALVDTELRI